MNQYFFGNRLPYVNIYNCESVKSKENYSDRIVAKYGVPRGSILGPVLFILYINALDTLGSQANFTLYANDISLIISHKNKCSRSKNIIEVLIKQSSENDLYLNSEKTTYMRFLNRQKVTNSIDVKIGDRSLAQQQCVISWSYVGQLSKLKGALWQLSIEALFFVLFIQKSLECFNEI